MSMLQGIEGFCPGIGMETVYPNQMDSEGYDEMQQTDPTQNSELGFRK